MGTCIICGSPADGDVCETHEEDAFFEFRGSRPDQLTPNRYYRGTVDGFAEFGVFVDIGSVTGLLHRSEIPKRLESLEWDPGDEVFVQVLSIHDNGNIDLGWSLRQVEREFRGKLIDDPSIARPLTPEHLREETGEGEPEDGAEPDEDEEEGEPESEPTTEEPESESAVVSAEASATPTESSAETAAPEQANSDTRSVSERAPDSPSSATGQMAESSEAADTTATPTAETTTAEEETERVPVEELSELVGEIVVLEGEIADVRQTSGPTVFSLEDETGTVECAAFKEAGVRAYPDVEMGDVGRLVGEVERRRGSIQVETTSLDSLSGDEADAVSHRLEEARIERARPNNTDLLVDDPGIEVVSEELLDAATIIRRAVYDERPVILRHTATLEGYVAGTAIERALLPLIREEHAERDAEYHYVDRRPLDDEVYDLDAATDDVTNMLEAADRHGEKHPLFVLVDAGSTQESIEGLEFLSIYEAGTVVIDGGYADAETVNVTNALVSPTAAGAKPVSTGTLGSHLAALINDDVRRELDHLPATSYWDDVPDPYVELAERAGYDLDELADIRNAVTLEAFYQAYEDKRELVADLFWDERNLSLAAPISEQFREKLETEFDTARTHLDQRDEAGVSIAVLDVEAYTFQYDFPPVPILVSELHRRNPTDAPEPRVTIGFKRDELRLKSTTSLDIRAIGETVASQLPEAGVTPRGGRDGRIEFLAGERESVLEAVIDEVAAWLG